MNISIGLIKNFYEDIYYKIGLLYNIRQGSLGNPLINEYNLKVIE